MNRPIILMAPTRRQRSAGAPQQEQKAKPFSEMLTKELRRLSNAAAKHAGRHRPRIELHRPLRAAHRLSHAGDGRNSARRVVPQRRHVPRVTSGQSFSRSSAITRLHSLTSLARSHSLSPNSPRGCRTSAFGIAGIIMIARMETPGDRDVIGNVRRDSRMDHPLVGQHRDTPRSRRTRAWLSARALPDDGQLRPVELPVLLRPVAVLRSSL